jgi:hypothetical protein
MNPTLRRLLLAVAATSVLLFIPACPSPEDRSEGWDRANLPADVRADYEVFAQRCSKCHSLARPLNSGISDDNYWIMYVARMRRQPESGISLEDSRVILRFLHYYSLEQIRKKAEHGASAGEAPPPGASPPSPSSPPAPPPSPAGTSDAG